MPNGSDITESEFDRLEKPLRLHDGFLAKFAKRIGGEVISNYHGSPARQIEFRGNDGITRSIQLRAIVYEPESLDVLKPPLYLLGIAAWKDLGGDRRTWHQQLVRTEEVPANLKELETMFQEAYAKVEEIGEEKLG